MSKAECRSFATPTNPKTYSMEMPDPNDQDLEDPLFNAIYQAIKTWDVNVPDAYGGYCGANGSHAKIILDAVRSQVLGAEERRTAWERLHNDP
jgi:hypothetical protein